MKLWQKSLCDAGSFAVTTPPSRSRLRFIRGFEQKKKKEKRKSMLLSVRKITAQHLRPISVNSHLDMGERGTKVNLEAAKITEKIH